MSKKNRILGISEDKVLDLELKLKNNIYNVDLKDQLSIDMATLDSITRSLAKQPSLFAWYAVLHAMAEKDKSVKEDSLKLLYAQLSRKIRKKAVKNNNKETENSINAQILMNDDYKKIQRQLIQSTFNSNILKAAVDAFKMRKDILQSVSSNRRSELDRGIKKQKQTNY